MTSKIKSRRSYSSGYKHLPRGVSVRAFERVYWPYLPLLLIVSLLLVFSSYTGALQASLRNPGSSRVLSYATSTNASALLRDTNAERLSNGGEPLKVSSKLNAAAQAKANDMAARNYWSHNTPDGNPPWDFVSSFGYSYQKVGENLAAGFRDEAAAVDGWMASPPHRQNLLDPAYAEVGFGFANSPNYSAAGGGPMTIIVAFYGLPPGAKPTATIARSDGIQLKPATSETEIDGSALATSTSPAQLGLSGSKLAPLGTVLASVALIAVTSIWASRHALAIRRTIKKGERFVVRHPLIDIALILIIALLFIISRSAGFIQ